MIINILESEIIFSSTFEVIIHEKTSLSHLVNVLSQIPEWNDIFLDTHRVHLLWKKHNGIALRGMKRRKRKGK